MKGERHTTEQKTRILREADGGRRIVDVNKEHNISEVISIARRDLTANPRKAGPGCGDGT